MNSKVCGTENDCKEHSFPRTTCSKTTLSEPRKNFKASLRDFPPLKPRKTKPTAQFKGYTNEIRVQELANKAVFSLSISEGNASDKLMDLEQQLKEAKILAEESDR